jgi:hypothetical protein
VSAADTFLGWIEASSARETAFSLLGCAMAAGLIAWLAVGAVFLARHTTADVADWWRGRRFQASARRAARMPVVSVAIEITVRQPAPEVQPDPVVTGWRDAAYESLLSDIRADAQADPQQALDDAYALIPDWDEDCLPPRPEPVTTDLFAGWSKAQIERAVEDLIVEARREHRQVFGLGGAA